MEENSAMLFTEDDRWHTLFFAEETGSGVLRGSLSLPAIVLSGGFSPRVSFLGSPLLPPMALSGLLTPAVDLGGSPALPPTALSGAFTPGGSNPVIGGAPQLAPTALSGAFAAAVVIDGSTLLPPTAAVGSLITTVAIAGASSLAPLAASGSLSPRVALAGTPALAPASLAGSVTPALAIGGSPQLAPAALSGALTPNVPLSGSPQLAPVTIAGSFTPVVSSPVSVQVSGEDFTGGTAPTSTSRSVTLGAGSNRLLIVAATCEAASANASQTTAVTYNGISLAKCTDGTDTADLNTLAGSDDFANLTFWVLREADMPADGAQTLATTIGATGRNSAVAWWILENCDQSANIRDVAMNFASSGSNISANADAITDGAIIATVYKNNNNATSPTQTVGGSAATLVGSENLTDGGAHVRFFHFLGANGASVACAQNWTDAAGRRGIVVISLSPA